MFKYAQIESNGRCFTVSYLSGEADSESMLLLNSEDDVRVGDVWDGETWIRPEPVPSEPENVSLAERIALLESALDELLLGGM
ncbi:hypothetical protein PaecuDRAFT_3138 [Paenibacillus curdlanolyticus YK9]|uniref:Uncharacterized protein n=1 Tax=Paenibacillus curdlanolyticus YK9 TaxID=717606 RepID=E0IBU9_9BACL|nr:hypothetical protein [Paenibacillus curdlanolyticus]EFM10179.1 hypothetical protein PaecuDRAFT_3138 [Paenibacillus curdlanolyticus YK9]